MESVTPRKLGRLLRGKPSEIERAHRFIEERIAGASSGAARARAVGISPQLWFMWRREGLLPDVRPRAPIGTKIALWHGDHWIRGVVQDDRVEFRASVPRKRFTLARSQLPNFISAMKGVGWK